MTLLLISDHYPPEMTANAAICRDYSQHWAQHGPVTVITGQPNVPDGQLFPGYQNQYEIQQDGAVKVVRVKTYMAPNRGRWKRSLDFASFMATSFFAGLKEKKITSIVVITPQLLTTVSGWLLSRIKRKPFIMILCDLWPASIEAVDAMKTSWLLRGLKKLEQFMYRRADAIIALSPAFKTQLVTQDHIPAEKIHVILTGVNTQHFKPQAKNQVPTTHLTIGFVGTMGAAHQLSDTLNALANLTHSTHPSSHSTALHACFIGSGAEKSALQQHATDLKLTHVTIAGPVSQAEAPRYWSLIDVALISLRPHSVFSTVMPTKILEAMAMEKPILLYSPAGVASAFIEEHQCGIWVPSGNQGALEATLKKLAHLQYELNAMGERGRAVALQYDRQKQAMRCLDVISGAAGIAARRIKYRK